MSICADKIKKIAKLARIRIQNEEIDKYSNQLNVILYEIEKLQEVVTSGIEPMANVTSQALYMSDDIVADGNKTKEVLANAKETKYNCYVVPKVIE
jgi:aspartyl-tRNA(Asn)/glutamyl-tRNA(Gln) amidotransferase subunit C